MKFVSFLSVFALSTSAYAVKPSQVDFSKINLVGVQVIEKESRMDSFQRRIKLVKNPSAQLVQTLQIEAANKVVSPIYELDEDSSFKNIYVYVGKTEDNTFEFVQAMFNRSGSIFVVDMDITDVTKKAMKTVHGPSDDRVYYTIQKPNGNLFP